MKEPKEMIKFFAVNQKVGKRIKEGKMVTVDYPFKYTQKDLDAVREAVIAEVLEIIDKDKEEHAKYDRLLKPMWLRGCFDTLDYLREAVLALKGGKQE